MSGRLEQIESMLAARWGHALLADSPEMVYGVNEILVRFGRTGDTLSVLWRKLDSMLFNAVYTATRRTMIVVLDDGRRMRVTSEQIRDLSDRLLSLAYARMNVSPSLQDALYDFSRDGSFAAMRELARRFPLDEMERACIEQVLEENNQTA